MAKAIKTIRRSLHALCRSYSTFATTAALLVFPVSAPTLLAQSLNVSSPLLRAISSRLAFLFEAAGFPPSQFFSLLNFKLSQSILTFVITLPFTFTFLVLAKASVFQIIYGAPRRGVSSFLRLYPSLALTHLFNSLFILFANAAVLSLLFLAFNAVDILRLSSGNSVLALSASGVILYSFVLASAAVTCNLATVISAVDDSGGYRSILKALMLVRGRTATAITLALPASLGTAAIEALFRYRVMGSYRASGRFHPSIIWEAFSIIYLHSLLVILDTVITCIFLKGCKYCVRSSWNRYDYGLDIESEEKVALQA